MQTVDSTHEPLCYRLIRLFGDATGVPIIFNTSFDLRGEPIVNTPQESFRTFSASEMDVLALGNYLIEKD